VRLGCEAGAEMIYDSRVTDQATATQYYGDKAVYKQVGHKYTTADGENIELGDHGFFKLNGELKISADKAEEAIKGTEARLTKVKSLLAGVMFVRTAQAADVATVEPSDAIPWKWVAHAAIFLGSAYLIDKYQGEIADLLQKIGGPQGVQYALKATVAGNYPIMSFGKSGPNGYMPLNAGDVWKYGETINPETRYDASFLNGIGVRQEDQFWGN